MPAGTGPCAWGPEIHDRPVTLPVLPLVLAFVPVLARYGPDDGGLAQQPGDGALAVHHRVLLALELGQIHRHRTIVGADFAHGMLTIAETKRRTEETGGRIRLVEADALALPFEARTFAFVTSTMGTSRNPPGGSTDWSPFARPCKIRTDSKP